MADAPDVRRRDEFADRMCRESDVTSGPLAWVMHSVVLAVVAFGSWWTLDGIRDLRDSSRRSKAELREFRQLCDRAARSPVRDTARIASELGAKIQAQGWHAGLDGVRPRVLRTPTGLRVRMTRTVPGLRRESSR